MPSASAGDGSWRRISVECHRVAGEDCFILKLHIPALDQLDRVLDQFLAHRQTTTSIVQSTTVPLRPLPRPGHDGWPHLANQAAWDISLDTLKPIWLGYK